MISFIYNSLSNKRRLQGLLLICVGIYIKMVVIYKINEYLYDDSIQKGIQLELIEEPPQIQHHLDH